MQSAKEGTLDTASTKRPENIRREKRRSASRSPVRGMRRYFFLIKKNINLKIIATKNLKVIRKDEKQLKNRPNLRKMTTKRKFFY